MEVLDIIIKEPFSLTKTKLEHLGLVVKEYPQLDLYLVKYDKKKSEMENFKLLKTLFDKTKI